MRTALPLAIAFATAFVAFQAHAETPVLRVCTGATDGNYHFAGTQIREQGKGTLDVQLVPGTPGRAGSGENLERLSRKECDAAFVQSDAFDVYGKKHPGDTLSYEVAGSLYQEALHLICNQDLGLSKITGLTSKMRVLVGPDAGGSATTWDALVLADPKRYGVVQTGTAGGVRAATQVATRANDAACMLYVTGLNAPAIREINEFAKVNPKLDLIGTADSDLLKLKDGRGHEIYSKFTIPGGTYRNLQHGTFSTAVDSVAVTAMLIVNSDYIDANPSAYNNFLRFVTRATPAIRQHVGQ